ncbi:hypothetical protein EYF80_035365 [Liparis tanakae]|uniref:Uncharacterized protein n=1 Tax=Liparis tanakae TaxID=230148 RepID=A0A4Z2GLS5_9TELE|nr:hypothetical protein EYF80_035365 [Liparis tanakae]
MLVTHSVSLPLAVVREQLLQTLLVGLRHKPCSRGRVLKTSGLEQDSGIGATGFHTCPRWPFQPDYLFVFGIVSCVRTPGSLQRVPAPCGLDVFASLWISVCSRCRLPSSTVAAVSLLLLRPAGSGRRKRTPQLRLIHTSVLTHARVLRLTIILTHFLVSSPLPRWSPAPSALTTISLVMEPQHSAAQAVLPPPRSMQLPQSLLQAVDGLVVTPPPQQGAELSIAVLLWQIEAERRGQTPHEARRGEGTGRRGRTAVLLGEVLFRRCGICYAQGVRRVSQTVGRSCVTNNLKTCVPERSEVLLGLQGSWSFTFDGGRGIKYRRKCIFLQSPDPTGGDT